MIGQDKNLNQVLTYDKHSLKRWKAEMVELGRYKRRAIVFYASVDGLIIKLQFRLSVFFLAL